MIPKNCTATGSPAARRSSCTRLWGRYQTLNALYRISPNSQVVVFILDLDFNDVFELYRVPVTGGSPIRLNDDLASGGGVLAFDISADGQQVVYLADQDTDEVSARLYSVPLVGGTPTRLNDDLVFEGDVDRFDISPDGGRVVYRADQDADEVYELYSVPIVGGTAVRLNEAMVGGGDVFESYRITPNSLGVVYVADQDTDDVYEIYQRAGRGRDGEQTQPNPGLGW